MPQHRPDPVPACRHTACGRSALAKALALRCTIAIAALLPAASALAAEAEDERRLEFRQGTDFQRELDRPITISWDEAELRPLLKRLTEERRIAILLDRRIDPGSVVDAHLPPMTLREALEAVARQVHAEMRVVGDTAVIGPPDSLRWLRTLCLLKSLELDRFGEALGRRQFELARSHSMPWDDLDRPADLLLRIAQRAGLQIESVELLPHDLWARGVAVGMNCTEALCWLLLQYDLTFEWRDAGTAIRLVPFSGPIALERRHTVRVISPQEALRRVQERLPHLDVRLEQRELVATGLVEDHEIVEVLARGGDPDRRRTPAGFGPLARRRFTLRVVRQPAEAVLRELRENGVDIQTDDAALAEAQVDLTEKISFEIRQATIQELMEALCRPLGATFEVAAETVYIPARAGGER